MAHSENCVCANQFAKDFYDKLEKFIDGLNINLKDKRRKGHLIQILHKAQHIFGYLPEEVQVYISEKINVPHSQISGIISFYNFFTTKPKGKNKIAICLGTACFVKGAADILEEFERQLSIKAGEVTNDGEFSIDVVRCIGACGLAPVLTVNDKVYGKLTKNDVEDILSNYK